MRSIGDTEGGASVPGIDVGRPAAAAAPSIVASTGVEPCLFRGPLDPVGAAAAWSDLPAQLLAHILSWLHYEDPSLLLAAASVCKAWHQVTYELLSGDTAASRPRSLRCVVQTFSHLPVHGVEAVTGILPQPHAEPRQALTECGSVPGGHTGSLQQRTQAHAQGMPHCAQHEESSVSMGHARPSFLKAAELGTSGPEPAAGGGRAQGALRSRPHLPVVGTAAQARHQHQHQLQQGLRHKSSHHRRAGSAGVAGQQPQPWAAVAVGAQQAPARPDPRHHHQPPEQPGGVWQGGEAAGPDLSRTSPAHASCSLASHGVVGPPAAGAGAAPGVADMQAADSVQQADGPEASMCGEVPSEVVGPHAGAMQHGEQHGVRQHALGADSVPAGHHAHGEVAVAAARQLPHPVGHGESCELQSKGPPHHWRSEAVAAAAAAAAPGYDEAAASTLLGRPVQWGAGQQQGARGALEGVMGAESDAQATCAGCVAEDSGSDDDVVQGGIALPPPAEQEGGQRERAHWRGSSPVQTPPVPPAVPQAKVVTSRLSPAAGAGVVGARKRVREPGEAGHRAAMRHGVQKSATADSGWARHGPKPSHAARARLHAPEGRPRSKAGPHVYNARLDAPAGREDSGWRRRQAAYAPGAGRALMGGVGAAAAAAGVGGAALLLQQQGVGAAARLPRWHDGEEASSPAHPLAYRPGQLPGTFHHVAPGQAAHLSMDGARAGMGEQAGDVAVVGEQGRRRAPEREHGRAAGRWQASATPAVAVQGGDGAVVAEDGGSDSEVVQQPGPAHGVCEPWRGGEGLVRQGSAFGGGPGQGLGSRVSDSVEAAAGST